MQDDDYKAYLLGIYNRKLALQKAGKRFIKLLAKGVGDYDINIKKSYDIKLVNLILSNYEIQDYEIPD